MPEAVESMSDAASLSGVLPGPPVNRAVPFREAFLFWLKLGFISFGGPAGQIAIMHRELVERRRWISEERFMHALNYCMLLPGPEAQQLATYIGWLLHRVRGGIVAGVLFVFPSIFVLCGLSYVYAAHGETAAVAGVLYGFRPVVVAIVCEAVLRIGRRAVKRRWHLLVSGGAFVAIYYFGVPFPLIVLSAAFAGWAGSRILPALNVPAVATLPAERTSGDRTESGLAIDDTSPPAPHTLPSARKAIVVTVVCLLLWLSGRGVLAMSSGSDSLHVREYEFFTKAAFVTFGGAYAVLAYVAQAAVERFQWLTHAQTVDGLALAETTPGPLIMVVQFVGFMAAWNHPVSGMTPLGSALVGAMATTFATFLPCFFFIFLGAPYIELLRSNRDLDGALRSVTAAVVGVVLNLALVFGSTVLLPPGSGRVDWAATAIAILAFGALWKLRADVLLVVVAGGMIGFLLGLV